MARPREFDPDAALDRAMQTFWAKGYERTSLDDLCAATGLSRSSLYGGFGNKRTLLLRSLRRYEEQAEARVARTFRRGRSARQAVAALLDDFIDQIVIGPGRRGCFIGNCIAELAGRDTRMLTAARRSLGRIEAQFRAALTEAKMRGDLPATGDPVALARYLTSSIQGLRLIGKSRPDRAALADIACIMLRCFDR
jgi:TetR/AcrR family transcriptional repressor of nem operon